MADVKFFDQQMATKTLQQLNDQAFSLMLSKVSASRDIVIGKVMCGFVISTFFGVHGIEMQIPIHVQQMLL